MTRKSLLGFIVFLIVVALGFMAYGQYGASLIEREAGGSASSVNP